MGGKEYAQMVRGSGQEPISTTQENAFETDNYREGSGFDFDGSAYPYTIDPAEDIQELNITGAGDIDVEITTTSGTVFTLRLNGTVGSYDKWSIDQITFEDPRGTGAKLIGGWAGE